MVRSREVDIRSADRRLLLPDERSLLDAALRERSQIRGGGPAVRQLVAYLAPVVQARVSRALLAHGRGRVLDDPRPYVEELVQVAFARLFADDWRALRRWDPARGLSLQNWVGRITVMRVRDELRVARRDPWRFIATEASALEGLSGGGRPDEEVEMLDLWAEAERDVLSGLTDLGKRMFTFLVKEDLSTQEIHAHTALAPEAIFQWRRRLRVALENALRRRGGTP